MRDLFPTPLETVVFRQNLAVKIARLLVDVGRTLRIRPVGLSEGPVQCLIQVLWYRPSWSRYRRVAHSLPKGVSLRIAEQFCH